MTDTTPILPGYSETPYWYRHEGMHSWAQPRFYSPPSYQHYKVTIRQERPDHDGYCSDVDAEDDEAIVSHPARIRYVEEILVKAFPMDTWDLCDFTPRFFRYYAGCVECEYGAKSGYCRIPTKVTLLSVERFV